MIFFTVLRQQPMRLAICSIDMSVDERRDTILPTSAPDSAHPFCDTTLLPMLNAWESGGSLQWDYDIPFSPGSISERRTRFTLTPTSSRARKCDRRASDSTCPLSKFVVARKSLNYRFFASCGCSSIDSHLSHESPLHCKLDATSMAATAEGLQPTLTIEFRKFFQRIRQLLQWW